MYVGDDDDSYERPDNWDEQSYSSFTGTFDELMFGNCTFRNNTKLTKIEFKFPKLIHTSGDFYNNTRLTEVKTDLCNLVFGLNTFDCCK